MSANPPEYSLIKSLSIKVFGLILDHLDLRDRFALRRTSPEIKLKVDQYLKEREELIVTNAYSPVVNKWHFTKKPIDFQQIALNLNVRTIQNFFNDLQRLRIRAVLYYDDLLELARKLPSVKTLELEFMYKLTSEGREPLCFLNLQNLKIRFAPDQNDQVMFCCPRLTAICLCKCALS